MAYPTEDQIRTAFEMLNFPYEGPLVLVDNLAMNVTTFQAFTANSVPTLLSNWLRGNVVVFPNGTSGQLDATSGTHVTAIIVEYLTYRPGRGMTYSGGLGSITGFTFNVDDYIGRLIKDLEKLVPFYKTMRDLMNESPVNHSCAVRM